MLKQEIKPGDVVVLMSGGPEMTVCSVTAEGVECIWFEKDNHKDLHARSFKDFTLRRVYSEGRS